MAKAKKSRFHRFLVWRYKHISNKNFVYLLSIAAGLLAGIAAVTLKNITYWIERLVGANDTSGSNPLYFILPVIGLILVYFYITVVVKKPIRNAISSILFALSKKQGNIKMSSIHHRLITAPLTVGFGGSVGLLGPAVATGAALSSNLGRLFHMDSKTKILLIGCASAGAIASIFQSPIAAIIFAVEIFSLDLTLASLLPLLLASISGVLTSYFFLGNEVLFNFQVTQGFEIKDTLFYVLLGGFTAIASIYFSKMYFAIHKLFKGIKNGLVKVLTGGFAIGAMLYFIPPLYGEGFGLINNLLDGNHLAALGKTPFDAHLSNIWVVISLLLGITVFKAIAMTTTFAAGGTGGIFIPTMVMGSSLGHVVAKVINNSGLGFVVNESNFTLIGMAGLITGVLHAPLTAIFLIAEITGGYQLFVPLMITASISYLITRNTLDYTIYTRELAKIGALITHNKDDAVLTLMDMNSVIERNFVSLHPEMSLGAMLHDGVAKSTRNLFPVIDEDGAFLGVVLLDDIREFMFDVNLYNSIKVESFMHDAPDLIIFGKDSMKTVMRKFQDSGAWNLPVIKDGVYYGFISKSKMLTAYRRKLINFSRN